MKLSAKSFLDRASTDVKADGRMEAIRNVNNGALRISASLSEIQRDLVVLKKNPQDDSAFEDIRSQLNNVMAVARLTQGNLK